MPIVYQGHELTCFKAKTAGKNKGTFDGFYHNAQGEHYFIKKPDDQRELFAELFAGLILQEFINRRLIDADYFPSLIVADKVRFAEGSYGLIQPMRSFTELYKIIGTSYADGSDRNPALEAARGPQYYKTLMQNPQYGLSVALMFSLLLGAHSVHSGNMVALLNKKGVPSGQYARLDWGDAFRNFADPTNNDQILYAAENQGWLNPKKLFKGYFLNYKLIPGLFPEVAQKGIALTQRLEENTLLDIVISALKNIPTDLIGANTKAEFAKYACIDSFQLVALGPETNGGQFAVDMARTLTIRLEKITQLHDVVACDPEENLYHSTLPPFVLPMEEKKSFPDLLSHWDSVLPEHKLKTLDMSQINLCQLALDFNQYISELATRADKVNLWQDDPALLNKNGEDQAPIFVSQYKESTIFCRLFTLNPKTLEPSSFAVYRHLTEEYIKENPLSSWTKMHLLAKTSHDFMHVLRLIDNGQRFHFNHLMEEQFPILRAHLHDFMRLHSEVKHLLSIKPPVPEMPSTSLFYPIDDPILNNMNGHQLATICLEELNQQAPSPLVKRIIKNEMLWSKLDKTLNQSIDNPQKKVATLYAWRQLEEEQRHNRSLFSALPAQVHEITMLKTVVETKERKLNKQRENLINQERLSPLILIPQIEHEAEEKDTGHELEHQIKHIDRLDRALQVSEEKKETLMRWLNESKDEGYSEELLQAAPIIDDYFVKKSPEPIQPEDKRLQEMQFELHQLNQDNAATAQQIQSKNSDLITQLRERIEALDHVKQTIEHCIKEQEKYTQDTIEKKQAVQQARRLKMTWVSAQMTTLEKKLINLEERKERDASSAANKLIVGMKEEIKAYINSDADEKQALDTFQTHCTSLIDAAKEPLAKHRKEWKYALTNLSLVILSAVVGYLIAALINKHINDHYTFFSVTESKQQLDELDERRKCLTA